MTYARLWLGLALWITAARSFMFGADTGVASAASWTDASKGLTGPVAGVRDLVIDRATGSTLYAAGNGVFRSTDGGASWTAIGGATAVQVLALDPTTASTIYAGATRGVFSSMDGGTSWVAAGLAGMAVNTLVVDPITPSTLYAGAYDAYIYKSTDGGQNWTAFTVGLPAGPYIGVSAIILDPATPSTLYVVPGGLGGSSLYKSTDGAQTWNVINPGPVVRFLATTPLALYALIAPLGLAKSTDGGATWVAIGLNQDVVALAVDTRNPNTLYASTSAPVGTPPAMYKSTDGGQKWNPLNANLPLAQSLVLNPANPSVIYAANSARGVFTSSDAGTTWSESNTGLRAPGIQVLVGDPADPAAIYAGGDGGLFKSVDSGASWNQQAVFQVAAGTPLPGVPLPVTPIPPAAPASVHSLLIDFTNPDILYAGTARTDGCFYSDVLLYKSTDGGATWSDSINPDRSGCSDDTLLGMDPSDSNTLYLRSGDDFDGYGVRKSTDAGATWGYTSLYANELYALVIDPTAPATLYAGTDSGVVRTTDGGATWNPLGLPNMSVSLLAINPRQPNILYAATTAVYPDTSGFTGLFRSTDSGANWAPINAGLKDLLDHRPFVTALVVDPVQTDVLYLATTGFGVFKSSDGGANWGKHNDGLTFLDVRGLAIVAADSTTVYAGTPGGVFRIGEDRTQ